MADLEISKPRYCKNGSPTELQSNGKNLTTCVVGRSIFSDWRLPQDLVSFSISQLDPGNFALESHDLIIAGMYLFHCLISEKYKNMLQWEYEYLKRQILPYKIIG